MTSFKLYTNVSELPKEWDELPVRDVFLKTPFLKALETSSPGNISTYFLGVFNADTLVGIAIIQRIQMYLDDVFRRTSNKLFKRFGKFLISRIVKGNALVVGNLMHTGQHGLYYNPKTIEKSDFLHEVWKGIEQLSLKINKDFNKKIRIIGFKDYFENDEFSTNETFFDQHRLYKAKVQPNMIFNVQKDWSESEAYIAAFNKKYRRRFRTARKKCCDVDCRELSLNDVSEMSTKLFELYENVSDNAGVNSFKLEQQHFYQLKRNFETISRSMVIF